MPSGECAGGIVSAVSDSVDSPAALDGFGDDYPSPLDQARVTAHFDNDIGDLGDDRVMAILVEAACGHGHLYPDDARLVAGGSVDSVGRKPMQVAAGDRLYCVWHRFTKSLSPHDDRRELLG